MATVVAPSGDDAKPDPSPVPKAAPGVAREHSTPYRTDAVALSLSAGGGEGAEIDYRVKMKAGDVLVYDWRVEGGPAPGDFYSSFQGEPARPAEAVSYKEGTGISAAGSLTAPFEGTHGWLFKNDSDRPVTVKLTIAGFYDLPSLRETMGLDGPKYIPFGPPGWPDRFGPAGKK
ncbi:MAG TPA: hypothetical protein VL358_07095 [Caulobacteraceae bacterium]|nr:hypothetical protein [Caulobacteraceae bacterium]